MTQSIQYRLRVTQTVFMALIGCERPCLLLNAIQLLYQRQSMLGLSRLLALALCFHRLAELTSGMCHATQVNKPIVGDHLVVVDITIGLQIALVPVQ